MNGKIFEEIKKKEGSKRKDKLRFFVALIVTNIFVFLIATSSNKTDKKPDEAKIQTKVIHPHYKMIVSPLNLYIDENRNAAEVPISLFTKSKKLLVAKAYLHEEVKKDDQLGSTPRFKIEIPEQEVLKIGADTEGDLLALPAIDIKPAVTTAKKRASLYEINL